MTLHAILVRLTPLWPILEQDFSVARLAVFGSHARGTQGDNSDVDLLVNFLKQPSRRRMSEMRTMLTKALGKKVDINEWHRVYDTPTIGFYVIADRVEVPRPSDNPARAAAEGSPWLS